MDQSTDPHARGGSRNRLVAILLARGIVVAVL
jgi:hypothetical protein